MIIKVKCPNCSRISQAYLLSCGDNVQHGSGTRHHLCSCDGCGGEFEAVEYLGDCGNWQLNKYRPAIGESEWTVVEDLPEGRVPLVITGPGGEYYKAVPVRESWLEKKLRKFFGKSGTPRTAIPTDN